MARLTTGCGDFDDLAGRLSGGGSIRRLPRSGLVVCQACLAAWRWKSSAQPDGGEVLAKRKGVAARRGLEEA